jgi:asparagine synthase (glutamine-hydrolysing)
MVCRRFLPEEILRRRKRGFAVNVVDEWFRGGLVSKMTDIFLDTSSCLYQYLRPDRVQHLFKEHRSGRNDYHKILFSLVVFEEWLRNCTSAATAQACAASA